MLSVCLSSYALSQHLPSYLGFSYLDKGYLLTAASSDLELGVAPPSFPAPVQRLLLGCGVAPLGHLPWCWSWRLMWRTDSLEKTLMLGGIKGSRRMGWQRVKWLNGTTIWWTWVWARAESWWSTGKPGVLKSMGSQRVGHDWATGLN